MIGHTTGGWRARIGALAVRGAGLFTAGLDRALHGVGTLAIALASVAISAETPTSVGESARERMGEMIMTKRAGTAGCGPHVRTAGCGPHVRTRALLQDTTTEEAFWPVVYLALVVFVVARVLSMGRRPNAFYLRTAPPDLAHGRSTTVWGP